MFGSAAGLPHRVPLSVSTGAIIDGRFVPKSQLTAALKGTKRKGVAGPVVQPKATPLKGAVPLSRPDQVTYANADGTHTTFDYTGPVNYKLPDGQWASINTTLVPVGSTPGASAGTPDDQGAVPAVAPTGLQTATFLRMLLGDDPSPADSTDTPTPSMTPNDSPSGAPPTPSDSASPSGTPTDGSSNTPSPGGLQRR